MDLEKVAIMRLRDGAEISKRYYKKTAYALLLRWQR